MDKIPSFTIDHTKLERGVYRSRIDQVGQERITTFDIRMKAPNREEALDIETLHTIEHLGATYLRNHAMWKDKVIYFGPMGCRTGNYLILAGDLQPFDIQSLLLELFNFMANYTGEIPGATERDCGNYQSMDLDKAKYESYIFADEVLQCLSKPQTVYP